MSNEATLLPNYCLQIKYLGLIYDPSEGFIAGTKFTGSYYSSGRFSYRGISQAKSRLLEYVNRRGKNPPEGLSAAGFSLWLMEKNRWNRNGNEIKITRSGFNFVILPAIFSTPPEPHCRQVQLPIPLWMPLKKLLRFSN
jgi:hypothetical protein